MGLHGLLGVVFGHHCRMTKDEHRYGSVPRSRRPLFAAALGGVALAVIVVGLLINLIADTSIQWLWLLVAAGLAVGMYAIYLWIRLSD